MKCSVYWWLAVSSLAMVLQPAWAETRPEYAGTLRLTTRSSLSSLDPADSAQPDSFARRSITLLLFDTLVTVDESGHTHAAIADSWQVSSNNQHWQLHVRRGVKFQDGTPLTTEIVAASLRTANPPWRVTSTQDSVIIESDAPEAGILAKLALPRNAIAKRDSGKAVGTGPFRVTDWQPGKKLTLVADESYWRGRPFLDTIEIEMGRSYRDQMTALEAGRADLIEVAPEQTHRVVLDGRELETSQAMELDAIVFSRDAQTAEERSLRDALSWSIDRGSIRTVLLQGAGQPAASLLPNWISGYAFVFPVEADLPRARRAREQFRTVPTWNLGYEGGDPLLRLVAERIALNARDAGLSLQPTSTGVADLRLLRIQLTSADPWIALSQIASVAGVPVPKNKRNSLEDLYAAEQALLSTGRIIPLFHVPISYAAGNKLKDWSTRTDGVLGLADAWLGSGKP